MEKQNSRRKRAATAEEFFAGMDELRAEVAAYIRESRAAAKELNAAQQRMEAENKQRDAENKQRNAEQKEADKRRDAENKRREERMNKMSGDVYGITSTMGLIAEDVFRRDFARIMNDAGVPLDTVKSRVRGKNHGPECDILGVNGDAAVLCEVKSRLRFDAVKEMEGRIATFREDFPRYARPKIYGAIAGLSVDKHAADYARKKGFFVLVERGASLSPLTPPDFVPRAY